MPFQLIQRFGSFLTADQILCQTQAEQTCVTSRFFVAATKDRSTSISHAFTNTPNSYVSVSYLENIEQRAKNMKTIISAFSFLEEASFMSAL